MDNNMIVKKVPIFLDKERTLVYDLNAYCELESYYIETNNPESEIDTLYQSMNLLAEGLIGKKELNQEEILAMRSTLMDLTNKQSNGFQQFYGRFLSGSPKAIRALLWAGLIHEDKNLKIEDVGKFTSNLTDVSFKILEALPRSMPENDEDEEKNV